MTIQGHPGAEAPKPNTRAGEPWGFWRALLMRKEQRGARIGIISSVLLMPAVGVLWVRHVKDDEIRIAEAKEYRQLLADDRVSRDGLKDAVLALKTAAEAQATEGKRIVDLAMASLTDPGALERERRRRQREGASQVAQPSAPALAQPKRAERPAPQPMRVP